jgi:hypothetical protein
LASEGFVTNKMLVLVIIPTYTNTHIIEDNSIPFALYVSEEEERAAEEG